MFYNVYENQTGFVAQDQYIDPYGNLIAPLKMFNIARAKTYGVELTGTCKLSDSWQVSANYTFLEMQVSVPDDTLPYFTAGSSPQSSAVQVFLDQDAGGNMNFDMRYVDDLPDLNVPSYLTMDTRLTWNATKNLEFAVIGRNLLASHHLEFLDSPNIAFYSTEVARSVFGRVTWRY